MPLPIFSTNFDSFTTKQLDKALDIVLCTYAEETKRDQRYILCFYVSMFLMIPAKDQRVVTSSYIESLSLSGSWFAY